MPMPRITWNNRALTAPLRRAERMGISETAQAGKAAAQRNIVEKNIVDTGHMLNTVEADEAREIGHRVEARFGNWQAGYALYHELGTYKMNARPWLMPALEEVRGDIPTRIRRHMP